MEHSRRAAAARLAAAQTARASADLARAYVGDTSAPVATGDRIRAVRRLRVLTAELMDWTVRAEFLAGASWAELASATGRDEATLRAEYEEGTLQWALALPEGTDGELQDAEMLDAWYRRHAEELVDPGENVPVSGLFTPPN
ncbi:hypothetical protein ABZ726_10600 [Streptomyces hundungensis]|uniref:hypothetical protein n=1 Tax=Streptomyces hundungensis TaxID=1077946 RepID=UPI0033DD8C05